MTRTFRISLVAVVVATGLAGCATAPMGAPTPKVTQIASSTVATSVSPPPVPPSTTPPAASVSPTASRAVKKLATAKLPTSAGDRRTNQVSESAGGQTAAYYRVSDPANFLIAALSPVGTAADVVAKLGEAKPTGPGTCGSLLISGKSTAACVVPLDHGYLLVNAAATQPVDEVAALTQAIYDTLA